MNCKRLNAKVYQMKLHKKCKVFCLDEKKKRLRSKIEIATKSIRKIIYDTYKSLYS